MIDARGMLGLSEINPVAGFVLHSRDNFMAGSLARAGRDLANALLSRNPEDGFQIALRRFAALDPPFTKTSYKADGDLLDNPQMDWSYHNAFLNKLRIDATGDAILAVKHDAKDIKTDAAGKRYVESDGKKLEVDMEGFETGGEIKGGHSVGGFLGSASSDLEEWDGEIPPAIHIPASLGCGGCGNNTLPLSQAVPQKTAPSQPVPVQQPQRRMVFV
jgi:hypothetical protein